MLTLLLSQLHRANSSTVDEEQEDNNNTDYTQDGSLANSAGLNTSFIKMDEEELVIDSPEQEPVEDEDLEDVDDNLKLGHPASSSSKPPKVKDGNREQFLTYPESLPYACESLAEMDAQLDLIVQRICQAVQARDYDIGLLQWNHRLECWISLKYPMKRTVRAKLAKLFYELAVLPGMDPRIIETASSTCMTLLANKKRLDINDLQLPWEPLYHVLEMELFPKKRKTGITNISVTLLTLTEYSQRFFPPHEIPQMLATFLPRLDGSSLNSILATQSFMAHFLPISHPQEWLTPSFVLWEAFSNSQIYTEQWLDVMSRLAEKHVDPSISDPKHIERLRNAAASSPSSSSNPSANTDATVTPPISAQTSPQLNGSASPLQSPSSASESPSPPVDTKWTGVRKEVGIFTSEQWEFLMQKMLRAMGIPVGNVRKSNQRFISQGGEMGAANADAAANSTALKMKKPSEKLHSLAILLVYSMSEDSPILDRSPSSSKQPSRRPSATDLKSIYAKGENLPRKAYIGGSRALDSLLTFMNATETFFHPSNYGVWTLALTRFLQNVTWEFTKRWLEEEKADCKTPLEWRLTPKIRREFVLINRQVALLAMFSKDMMSMGCAHSALKSMSFLEPTLVIPAVLERSFPALQGLLETHRTTACMGALSAIAIPFISRTNFPAGSKNLVPLLDLFIPGLDVNDPMKTLSSVAFFIQATATVKLADLTRPEASDDSSAPMELDGVHEPVPSIEVDLVEGEESTGPILSRQEEDDMTRQSTADLPEWIVKFFKAILALYDNLPEPGRSGRSGGKLEEAMISTCTVACDHVLGQSSPEIFDIALNIFKEHVINSPKANSARAIGHLAACFGRANPKSSLDTFLPICISKIKTEIEHGASSTRTTTSSTPIESDNALHWYCLLLLGSLHMAAEHSLSYKSEILELLCLMRDKCLSERGYTYTSRMLQAILVSLTATWARDGRSANADDWHSEEYTKRPHQHWGQLLTANEVKVDWHTPTEDEVTFAMEILDVVLGPALDCLDQLTTPERPVNKEWRNDFNRYTSLVRSSMAGVAALSIVVPPEDPGQDVTDIGDEDPEFTKYFPRCEYGAVLRDPNDPRLQRLIATKSRIQAMLLRAITRLVNIDDKSEDAIDSIKMAISTTKNVMLCHPMDRNHYATVKATFTFSRDLCKYTVNQKKFPRLVWVRRASLYHASRLRLNTFYRKRSKLDDQLIEQIAEMTMSKYVSVRKAAQRALDALTLIYDGTRTMLLDKFLNTLRPGNDPDRMKGALYVLGSKTFGNMAILDWSIGPRYIMTLLGCQHEQKPSVQQLVKSVTADFLLRLAEPSTIKLALLSPTSQSSAKMLELDTTGSNDTALIDRLSDYNHRRIDARNEAYAKLVPELLAVARDKKSHWRYVLSATRFLRALIRRDQPLPPDLCSYMINEAVSELPNQRSVAINSLTRILHFIKLRTFAPNPEDLLLQKTHNPLKRKIDVPDGIDDSYTADFLDRFKEPLRPDSILIDKHNTGWLAWGKSYRAYAVPDDTEVEWDATSAEALGQIREKVSSKDFWQSMFKILSQEHTRDYLALDNVTIIKSIFQIFRDEPLAAVFPVLEDLMTDNDRHKQRAAAEAIGGLLRGIKHWPLPKQKAVHEWLNGRWNKIFESINLDTQPAWEMMVEYVLGNRDPRRNESLMAFLTGLSIDLDSSEAFKQARKGYLLGSTMKSLSWHFTPWAPSFTEPFWKAITSPYTEVRLAVSDNLRFLSEIRLHPSFISTNGFLQACRGKDGMRLLIDVDDEYIHRIDEMVKSLQGWRAIRKPFAKDAVQPYDAACLTILTWLWSGMNDYRITTIYPFVVRLLPELMHMQDIQDNVELRNWAQVVLAAMAGLPYPVHLITPVLQAMLRLFKSESWRTRLAALPLLQVFFFHQLFSLTEVQIREVVVTLQQLLADAHIEVREAAATTLSGIVRCSQRDSVIEFKDASLKELKRTAVPAKKADGSTTPDEFQQQLLRAHTAVLGASSLVLAWAYEVPSWLPSLLVASLTKFSTSRAPVSTTVKEMLAQFRKTHQDTWAEDQKKFTSEQLQDLNDYWVGSSYYA